eukprot:contig_22359_g5522
MAGRRRLGLGASRPAPRTFAIRLVVRRLDHVPLPHDLLFVKWKLL